jgi:hypothetical protein
MISPSDEHVIELFEFKFLEYMKPRNEASFKKDKSGRDLQFHRTHMHFDVTNIASETLKG